MNRTPVKTLLHFVAIISLALAMLPAAVAQAMPAGAYIVQAAGAELAASAVTACGGQVTSSLAIINGVSALLSPQAASCLRASPTMTALTADMAVRLTGSSVEPSRKAQVSQAPATDYPDLVGADVAWEQGATGAGISVAVLDTGIGFHQGIMRDLDGRLNRHLRAWKDFVDGSHLPFDPNGHGTHIAGIIANTQLGADGEYNGVAPGVDLVGVRVLNEDGFGTYQTVIQGLQWAIENKERYNIRVINLSLVSSAQSPYWADPLDQAVSQAWAAGIFVVAAAGNGGSAAMSVGVPGNNPYILTVGAFTDNYTPSDWNDDYLAPFSAAGPTLDGFVKPDVLAPGAHIVSTMAINSRLARNNEASWISGRYFSMAGTSQAAAVASGVAALVIAQRPELQPDQVKYRLMVTAFPWVNTETNEALYSMWQQGAGRINAVDAIFAEADGSANQGLDIQADLAGAQHYRGYSYYDSETGQFRLYGDFNAWSGGYGAWSGGYGAWSGGYGAWSGGYGAWSGGYGAWSGGYGAWSGGYGAWSGGYGAWSGGYGAWSGGYGAWSGGYGAWSGSEPWAGSILSEPAFVQNFLAGVSPDASQTATFVENWVEAPTR